MIFVPDPVVKFSVPPSCATKPWIEPVSPFLYSAAGTDNAGTVVLDDEAGPIVPSTDKPHKEAPVRPVARTHA